MPEVSYPSIPDPNIDPGAMLNTLTRLKETVELMTGQSKDQRFSFPNQVRIVERRSATSSARFTEALQIQANSLQAVVVRTTTLEADMGDVQADIVSEQTVRATADTALATDITTLTATVGDVSASVTTEATARATADSALASDITDVNTALGDLTADVNTEITARISGDTANATAITNVSVVANGATASGQVYLKSEIAPGGYTSRYGWYLNVTGLPSIGMDALLTTGGVGEIAFTASKFKLVDPSYLGGAPIEVFTYNGTTFNFGVDVTIRNQEIGANAVSNTVTASGNVGSGVTLSTPSITVRAGARVLVEVKLSDTSGSIYLAAFSAGIVSRFFDVSADATIIGQLITMDTVVAANFLGGSSYVFYKAYTPSSILFVVTGLSAGSHTFSVGNSYSPTLVMSITATELSK